MVLMAKGFQTSGRPTVAEIDLRCLEFNYRQLLKRVPKGVKLLAVVKAEAYGHGAVPISLLEKLELNIWVSLFPKRVSN
jgi:alanine racemase